MSTPVEQIKERLNIADVVGSYLKLERAGSSLKAKCPFHNEKTPSFYVSPARGSFYCFGCNKGGDIFTFVQEFEGLDFVGALRVLASRAGVELRRLDPKVKSEYARLYLCLEKATRFYEQKLQEAPEAKSYLDGRGLLPETIKTWRVGFAPNDWRQLYEHLLKEGFNPEEMKKVGLVKAALPKEYSTASAPISRLYDAFRGRVMFPVRDSASRVIAFSARILPSLDDGKTGKYINSPETLLFSKSNTLYGFDRAKLVIRQKDATILVEGQMDLLMAHQAGFENTVASSGTALTEEQLIRLKRLSENLLISFDSDSAGVRASERAIRLALALGMNVKVIAIAKGKDPAELIQKDPKEWERAVTESKHVIDFLLDGILHSTQEGRERALAIEKITLPLLRALSSSVEQAHFVKVIAERTHLREEALWQALRKLSEPAPAISSTPVILKRQKQDHISRRIAAILFAAETDKQGGAVERFTKRLTEILGADEFAKFTARWTAEKDTLLAEAEFSYGVDGVSEREEEELLQNFEAEVVSASLSRAMEALSRAERDGKNDALPALLSECKRFSERLSVLKSARFSP